MSFKGSPVNAVGVIENTMQMDMLLVDMASHEILILTFEELLAYLLTDLQSSLRHNLPRLEAHNEVLGKDRTSACTVCPYFFVVTVSLFGIRAAPLCNNQSAVICFFGIGDVFQ